MIYTNMDGSPAGGANQLFDLLSVVSNPAEVKKRIADLQKAQADAQAVIDLVGPAQQILTLKDKAAKDAAAAAKALEDAKIQAEVIVQDANKAAATTIDGANQTAATLIADAKAKSDYAAEGIAAAQKQMSDAQAAQAAADAALKQANALKADLIAKQAAAQKAQDEAEALKAAIVEKHKAFIESL